MRVRVPHYPPLCFTLAVLRALALLYALGVLVYLAGWAQPPQRLRVLAGVTGIVLFVIVTNTGRELPGHWRRLQRWRRTRNPS